MIYKLADRTDIDLLVTKRLEFIEVKEDNKNFSELKENCYNYFQKALQDDTCDIVLAEENGVCIERVSYFIMILYRHHLI